MDASELTVGTYHANVCVGSNDPVRSLVAVPVTLTVTGGGTPSPTHSYSHACYGYSYTNSYAYWDAECHT